jgi:hypothetical protein
MARPQSLRRGAAAGAVILVYTGGAIRHASGWRSFILCGATHVWSLSGLIMGRKGINFYLPGTQTPE